MRGNVVLSSGSVSDWRNQISTANPWKRESHVLELQSSCRRGAANGNSRLPSYLRTRSQTTIRWSEWIVLWAVTDSGLNPRLAQI